MDAINERRELFPRLEPYARGMLDLDGGHRMYWEQSGNPDGRPVVFLHGGPGAGAGPIHRRFFDPYHYRIVVYDQRGAGRSRPSAELADNTTRHLVEDMERLREHLDVERWLVFGGSWGVLLGLAYGIHRPERCAGFVLRGVFLGRSREIGWFLDGMRSVFPEAWRDFAGFLPEDERGDLLAGYRRRLNDPDPAVAIPAARAWNRYESRCSNLLPGKPERSDLGEPAGGDAPTLALARIEAHYFKHRMFLDDGALLTGIHKLRRIPAVIVQGRYDMICPIVSADDLARAWPEADYVVVPDAGHSALEPSIRAALVAATESFKVR